MKNTPKLVHISEPLWRALEVMSEQMGVDKDALLNQAVYALARSHGFITPPQIKVADKPSPHGLGMHPPHAPATASIKFRPGKKAAVFKATVAIDDSTNFCFTPAVFTVWGDGKKLFESKYIAHNHARTQECSVDISGVGLSCAPGTDPQVPLPPKPPTPWLEPRVNVTVSVTLSTSPSAESFCSWRAS